MSTDTAYRFPTTTPDRVPIYPPTDLFETVKEDLGLPEIEEVMSRPRWTFAGASERALSAMLDKGWFPSRYGCLMPPVQKPVDIDWEGPKDRTKKRPTPKRPK